MPTQAEKLQSGIDSLTYRIAALAERLSDESTKAGDNPRDTARQINEYGRTLAILRGLLERLNGATVPAEPEPEKVYSYTIGRRLYDDRS